MGTVGGVGLAQAKNTENRYSKWTILGEYVTKPLKAMKSKECVLPIISNLLTTTIDSYDASIASFYQIHMQIHIIPVCQQTLQDSQAYTLPS